MKSSKKGEALVTRALITVIVLVLGLVMTIFIFMFYQSSGSGMVDREVCHQSVIYRATLPSFAGAKEYVPLKCKTQKMCITTGIIGGDCEEEFGKDSVMKVKVKNEEQISRAIADEIIDCWSTMGEGKVSIFSQWLAESYGIGGVYPSCVICSRIAFDNKLGEKGIDLEKVNVLDYMMRYKPKGKEVTYYDYLLGEGGQISVDGGLKVIGDLSEEQIEVEKKEYGEELKKFGERDFEGKTDIEGLSFSEGEYPEELNKEYGELAVVFTQISAPDGGDVLFNTLKAGAAFLGLGVSYSPGAFVGSITKLSPRIRWDSAVSRFRYIKGSVVDGVKVGGRFTKAKYVTTNKITSFTKILAFVAVVSLVAQQGNVALNREVTAGYCGDVSYGDEAREGCSVVRTINYDKQEISQYCSAIESID